MKRMTIDLIKDEKGLALVLAITLITLVASFGIWLVVEGQSGLRITRAYERIEETNHLAEGACWLSVRALDAMNLPLPVDGGLLPIDASQYLPLPNETATDWLDEDQNVTSGRYLTPGIKSSRGYYNTLPPPGWMLNWQGASGFHRRFYLARGEGEVVMTQARGNAKAVLFNLAEKVMR
jgi:hypothetical protein